MSDPVLYDARPDGIAIITINRPEQRNCLSREVREALFAALARFEADDASAHRHPHRRGRKGVLRRRRSQGDGRDRHERARRAHFPLLYDNLEPSKPTIAAVNGYAFAGGWVMAQNCDLCVASTSASFAITEVKVGRGSPWAAPLIHMIPQRLFMEIVLTGKPITAQRAYEIGLVNRLAEPAALMDTALELALRSARRRAALGQGRARDGDALDRNGPLRRAPGRPRRARAGLQERRCPGRPARLRRKAQAGLAGQVMVSPARLEVRPKQHRRQRTPLLSPRCHKVL